MLGALALVPLSACDTPPGRGDYPQLTYQHLPKLRFDVAEVEIVQAYQSPGQPPHVEQLFPVRPASAAANWGRDRIVAAGTARRLRYIVKEASVVEVPLAIDEGLEGTLRVEQSERYEARLVVEVQIIGETGLPEGTAGATAERSVTVAEDITLREREQVWFRLTERVMDDLNGQLEKTLPAVFSHYLLP